MKKLLALALLGAAIFAVGGSAKAATDNGPVYVVANPDAPSVTVYAEDNGKDGLQTEQSEDGTPADSTLISAP